MFDVKEKPYVEHSFFRKLMRWLYLEPGAGTGILIVLGLMAFVVIFVVDSFSLHTDLHSGTSLMKAGIPTAIVIAIYLYLRVVLGKRYLIALSRSSVWDLPDWLVLIRTKNGKVVEVSEDILWQSDICAGDDQCRLQLDRPSGSYLIKTTSGSITAQVGFTIKLHGENQIITWQQLYEAVCKNVNCDSISKFFEERIAGHILLHGAETAPIMEEYIQGKIKDSEMLRRLAENISGWQICPEFPDLKINITLSHDITIKRADGGVNVTIDGAGR
jgi:hypothetical protein